MIQAKKPMAAKRHGDVGTTPFGVPNRLLLFLLAALGLVLWFAPQKAQGCFTYAHKLAVDDLARQTPYQQYVSVYFWLGDVPKSERPAFILTFAGWLHALSKEPSLASFPQVVAADNSLLRIDYTRYRWTPELMQKLHKAHPFNTQVLTVASPPVPFVGGGLPVPGWRTEKRTIYHRGGSYTVPDDSGRYYPNLAAGEYNVELQFKSGASEFYVPLVGARWFIWQTIRNEGRSPNYNDFLGIKTRQDINELTGFNLAVQTKALRSDFVDVPRFSRIAQTYLRNVVIQPISGGWRYVTEDSEFAEGTANVIRFPDRKLATHDAEEHIFPLPNGMPGFGLTDGNADADKSKVQKSAPPFVGFDKSTPSNDARIEPVGCLRCHFRAAFGGSAALIDFVPHFRKRLSTMRQNTPDYERAVEFDRLYLRPFQHQLIIDRALFSQAIGQATGMTADEWAYRLTTIYEQYDAGGTLEEAAAQLGCETKFVSGKLVQQAIKLYATETNQLDNILGLFEEGDIIPRRAYHEIYPVLYVTLKGMNYVQKTASAGLIDPAGADGKRFILQLPRDVQLSTGSVPRASLPAAGVSHQQQLLPGGSANVQPGVRAPGSGDNVRADNNVPVEPHSKPIPARTGGIVNPRDAGSRPVRAVADRVLSDKGSGGADRGRGWWDWPPDESESSQARPCPAKALCQVPHRGHSGEGLQGVRANRPVGAIHARTGRKVDLSVVHQRPEVKDAARPNEVDLRGVHPSHGRDGDAAASSSHNEAPGQGWLLISLAALAVSGIMIWRNRERGIL
jgi:hypothetical protein